MNKIEKLKKIINDSNNIVAFTGAGVSTESGLKDFRSKDGLYNEKSDFPVEYLLSSDCFYNNPKLFYEYYKKNLNSLDVKPNITHYFLKDLEDQNKLKAIVTQNIDGLHTKAGSKIVYEIHGTTYQNTCTKCHKKYDAKTVFNSIDIPLCECGGIIKPDVTLYGESLPEDAFTSSIEAIKKADTLLIIGTSLTVYPASSLIEYFNGKNLVIINKDKTPYDNRSTLVINEKLKDVFTSFK